MSADRGDREIAPTDHPVSPRRPANSVRANDSDPNRVSTADASAHLQSVPLSARIERTRLELQVAALERALETSERRRQAVIDRYEQLLADQSTDDETSPSADRSDSVLERLLER